MNLSTPEITTPFELFTENETWVTDMKDPIVEEVRKARADHAQKFGHDMEAICSDLKRIERECGHEIVSLPPRLLTRAPIRPLSSAAEA